MAIKYRFVDFGAVFTSQEGVRGASDGARTPSVLYRNELAVDVGDVCRDYNSDAWVLDHHFLRPEGGQFPSASAAVLHYADRIYPAFAHQAVNGDVWLVSHWKPDFDAFCAMYLARRIIVSPGPWPDLTAHGLHPEGWFDLQSKGAGVSESARPSRIDWFGPSLTNLPKALRPAILLGALASTIDNGRRIKCPRNRSLHSVLYAALLRGRDYLTDHSGAVELFDEAWAAIADRDLNPLYDAILEQSTRFAPEAAMLDREEIAYARDLKRARRALVHLPRFTSHEGFNAFYERASNTRLLEEDGSIAAAQITRHGQLLEQADGIYLRDPECILFKEWARLDVDNSSMGRGFLFTAIVYSQGRNESETNPTDYFFSLDPERANGLHLYHVWARLQASETARLRAVRGLPGAGGSDGSSGAKAAPCRTRYEARAGDAGPLFDDPWYDGANYVCTILGTPNRGAAIGPPGRRPDLTDDPVVQLVQRDLEYAFFAHSVTVLDLAASHPGLGEDRLPETARPFPSVLDALDRVAAPPPSRFRRVIVGLDQHINVQEGALAVQIGHVLWRLLHGPTHQALPTDFAERHLLISPDMLGVWSRKGIAFARRRPSPTWEVDESTSGAPTGYVPVPRMVAAAEDDGLADHFRRVVILLRDSREFVSEKQGHAGHGADPERGDNLVREAARLRQELTLPENRLLRRFFEATQVDQAIATVRDVNVSARTAEHTEAVADVQSKVEWLEVFFVAFYATELIHIVSDAFVNGHVAIGSFILVAVISVGVAAFAVLKPHRHTPSWRPFVWLLAALAVLALLAAIIGNQSRHPDPAPADSSGAHGAASGASATPIPTPPPTGKPTTPVRH